MNLIVLQEENEHLKALLAEAQAALAESEEARRRLETIVGQLNHEKFGAKSEKLHPDQYHLPLEDVEIAQGVLDAAQEKARRWAAEIADLVVRHGGGNRRLAVDRLLPDGFVALGELGVEVVDGQGVAERARALKSADEVLCLKASIEVCQTGLGRLEAALRPGVTENELWATLHEANIALGGEYIETRLLTSGHRTNPWYQETSHRPIGAGELVAVDTDMIGPYGYFADMSRSFLCGDRQATGAQRTLYGLAYEQIHHNLSLLRPGTSFREFAERSWDMPDDYLPHRYMSLVHGAGLGGEYPYIPYRQDFDLKGYDGRFEAGMTLCVESFIGNRRGGEGVKLEQLVQVTPNGAVPLTDFHFDERLLGEKA